MTDWHWLPATPGNKYAIKPVFAGEVMPYTVCKIVIKDDQFYEAWHKATRLSAHQTPNEARAACVAHHNKESQHAAE